jgi:regulatory protein
MKSAREKALDYLGRYSRTEHQVRKYLSRKGYPPEEIEPAIGYLHDHRLLNDISYAEAFIQSRIRRCDGPLKIRHMLFEKGIDPQTSESLLKDQYPSELQLETAQKLLQRRTTQRRNRRNDAIDAQRFLASRGFPRYVIIQAFKRL